MWRHFFCEVLRAVGAEYGAIYDKKAAYLKPQVNLALAHILNTNLAMGDQFIQLILAVIFLVSSQQNWAFDASKKSCGQLLKLPAIQLFSLGHFKPISMLEDFIDENKFNGIYYFQEEELEPYRAIIQGGKIGRLDNGVFTQLGANASSKIKNSFLVVSPKGELFVGPADHHGPTSNIRHSSFLSGKSVGFAGHIDIENGNILKIDMASGHYQPPVSALTKLLDHLKAQNVPIEDIALDIYLDSNTFWSAETQRKMRKYSPAHALLYEMEISGEHHDSIFYFQSLIQKEIRQTGASRTLKSIFKALPEINYYYWDLFIEEIVGRPQMFDAKFVRESYQQYLMVEQIGRYRANYSLNWASIMTYLLQGLSERSDYSSLKQSKNFQDGLNELRRITDAHNKMTNLAVQLRKM